MKRSVQHSNDEKGFHYDPDTKAKIRKHLSDINDVITEDDIRRVRTDDLIPPAEENMAAEKEADKLVDEQQKEDENVGNDDGSNNADLDNDRWNVLNR